MAECLYYGDMSVVSSCGWYFCYGAYNMRDITDRQLVTVWASNSYTITVPCFKG